MRADTAIYNSILRLVAVDGGGPAGLEAVVTEMAVRGVHLDRRSYFLLLRAYGGDGDLSGAMNVMQRMLNDGATSRVYDASLCSLLLSVVPELMVACRSRSHGAPESSAFFPRPCCSFLLKAKLKGSSTWGGPQEDGIFQDQPATLSFFHVCTLFRQGSLQTASRSMRCWRRTPRRAAWKGRQRSMTPWRSAASLRTSAPSSLCFRYCPEP